MSSGRARGAPAPRLAGAGAASMGCKREGTLREGAACLCSTSRGRGVEMRVWGTLILPNPAAIPAHVLPRGMSAGWQSVCQSVY